MGYSSHLEYLRLICLKKDVNFLFFSIQEDIE